ncbi:uncharacterized protein BT62DRAFT_1013825 [Guyanagaster necrorhizus]|uniref:Uncharacterized protein n=1 Tax=Guyanagaster necrorhizus TaxID=856835 RepID=A0A9P7VEM9_9AGAR|nr:uncharacterized protein BT62DRAFT_1013825 [Guyanagaster necrorhizus MCA 3950]KAG7439528.1 hypothetical protein BT62DRAFT_1013825 [Guyanagaster necrorhizus MCA 3950]
MEEPSPDDFYTDFLRFYDKSPTSLIDMQTQLAPARAAANSNIPIVVLFAQLLDEILNEEMQRKTDTDFELLVRRRDWDRLLSMLSIVNEAQIRPNIFTQALGPSTNAPPSLLSWRSALQGLCVIDKIGGAHCIRGSGEGDDSYPLMVTSPSTITEVSASSPGSSSLSVSALPLSWPLICRTLLPEEERLSLPKLSLRLPVKPTPPFLNAKFYVLYFCSKLLTANMVQELELFATPSQQVLNYYFALVLSIYPNLVAAQPWTTTESSRAASL